jgi:hypothetical protein
MTKKDKLLERFFALPKDFTYNELKTIGHEIKIHKPHPGNIIKPYLMKYIYENLKERIL